MVDQSADSSFPVLPTPYAVRFPEAPAATEAVDVRIEGRWEHVLLSDRERLLALPGLYDQLVGEMLRCRAPKQAIGLFTSVLADRDIPARHLSVIDLGAGNGVVAEELRRLGVDSVVGIDVLPQARVAADRDRWGMYDDYLVADAAELSKTDYRRLIANDPDVLVAVAPVGQHDLSTKAFATAFNAIRTGGWVVIDVRDELDHSPFAQMLRQMTQLQVIRMEATKRYVQRLNVDGETIESVAIVARKLHDLPQSLVAPHGVTMDRDNRNDPITTRYSTLRSAGTAITLVACVTVTVFTLLSRQDTRQTVLDGTGPLSEQQETMMADSSSGTDATVTPAGNLPSEVTPAITPSTVQPDVAPETPEENLPAVQAS